MEEITRRKVLIGGAALAAAAISGAKVTEAVVDEVAQWRAKNVIFTSNPLHECQWSRFVVIVSDDGSELLRVDDDFVTEDGRKLVLA